MKNNSARIPSLLLITAFFTPYAHGEHDAIKEVAEEIKAQFINITPGKVFYENANKRNIPEKFKHCLKDLKIIKKIEEIAKNGTGGTSLDAVNMQIKITQAFDAKRDELFHSHTKYSKLELGAQIVIPTGIFVGVASLILNTPNLTCGAAFTTLAGITGWFCANRQLKHIEEHIEANNAMKHIWNDGFEKPDKQ